MSLPLIIKSKLFWYYNGAIDCAWYLSYASVEKQDAYIRDMDAFGVDTITLNLCNEEIGHCFSGEFMASSLDDRKINLLGNYITRLKNAGKNVVIVDLDCPPLPNPRYPIWKFTDRIVPFLEMATPPLAKICDGFILSIESNRGLSLNVVDYGVTVIQKHAVRNGVKLPVGTHEQSYRIAPHADFIGYETRNHPFQGWSVSVNDMVDEVEGLVAKAKGKPVWVIESNEREDAHAREQNRAMALIPGVVGVGGPL